MKKLENNPCSCNSSQTQSTEENPWIIDSLKTPAGQVPRVSTKLTWVDRFGGWKARWRYRMHYRVPPGLYAVGNPTEEDVILVTANYKLTFDKLRAELEGLDAWLLVLDTHGINVWCAAGKGLFSTQEVIRQLQSTSIEAVATNRTLILPQLAAPGVSGHQVKKETGYTVIFGPVHASDIASFLKNGKKAPPEMRTIQFPFLDRLVLIPVELVSVLKYFPIYFILAGMVGFAFGKGIGSMLATLSLPVLGALLVGTVLVPTLLPYLPFRSFTLKGWIPGILWASAVSVWAGAGTVQFFGNLLLLPVLSAGFALTFTGSTPFTSQTGVNKEIRLFARPMAISAVLGVAVMVANWLV